MADATPTILLVDDDAAITTVLASLVKQQGFAVLTAQSGAEALRLLDSHPVDVMITDLRMPGIDGMALLKRVAQAWPDLPTIVLSAHGTVPVAVEAMKAGALDFLVKPFDRDEVAFVLQKALAVAAAEPATAPPDSAFSPLGRSPAMDEVRDMIRRCASSNSTVLIRGESGTGKGVVARAIHEASSRKEKPFVTINCAALPDTLLESELFGYEKGAFTGASSRKPGRIEMAHGGTLLLDEIGDVPLMTQVKLLTVLQTRELTRLGGTQPTKVDVRFLAATHQDLEGLIDEGKFRDDLYHRLNVVPLDMPALRERPDDIELLAKHFLAQAAVSSGRPVGELASDALALLRVQPWPGNVRQLENFMERLLVLSDGPKLTRADVERELLRDARRARAPRSTPPPDPLSEPKLDDQRRDTERKAIVEALQRSGGNRSLAARLLGVSRRTLYTKLEELGLPPREGTSST